MQNLKAFTRVDEEALKNKFEDWDREKLIQYAISVTKAASKTSREDLNNLSTGQLARHPLFQGMALVEEIGQTLASTLELNEVLTRMLRLTNDALNVGDASIFLTEEPSGDLVSQISLGTISGARGKFRVPKGQGIAGEVALTGKPIRVDNAQTDRRHFKQIDRATGFLTQSILCVPLVARGKIIGVVEVFNKKSGPFTKADEALLCSMANYAAIGIENARLHQSVIEERDRVIKAQEEASHKLQRDLHDGPTQLVASIQMSIEFCKKALEKDLSLVGPELDAMYTVAQKATNQMRTLLFELRPLELEAQGLASALEIFVEKRQKTERTTLNLNIQSDQPDNVISRLKEKYEQALFAIIQESVNNALKYAKADDIFIMAHQKNGRINVRILDNGMGFDLRSVTENYEKRGSYGMVNQRERAGLLGSQLVMKSAPGAGTEIKVDLNISPDMLRQE
jgi:signal transduction histidine kinase